MKNKQITGYTGLIGLIANPIKHSKSPYIQNSALDALNLDYVYMVFEVNENELKPTIDGLKAMHARGWNVSMPYKEKMMEYMDEISEISQLTHSINTVINENGKLIGTSTDGIGFVWALKEYDIEVENQVITVLGTGGAALSIIAQSALDKAKAIHVFKRKNDTYEKAKQELETISKHTNCPIKLYDLQDHTCLQEKISQSHILVNATSVGMKDEKSLVPIDYLRKDLVVFDCIYNPLETKLLKDAKKIGALSINGLPMLLYQGAKSFELWTNEAMPIDIAKKALGL